MPQAPIYLDNAATSWPKPPAVARAMCDFLDHHAGNPGRGGHRLAREAAATVERARSALAGLINAPCPKRVVLTHGCTDSVNLAIHGVIRGAMRGANGSKPHAVMTTIEHNAVLRTLSCYAKDGLIDVTTIPCDPQGRVDPDAFAHAVTDRTVLACLSHASNALGTIQDVDAAIRKVRARNPETLVLVDAAQTVGHMPVDVQALDIDLLAIAGHKGLRGPTGTGALYVSDRAYPDECSRSRVFCERRGGTGAVAPGLDMPTELPDALEAGTCNAVGLAGLLAAIEARDPETNRREHDHEIALTARLLEGLCSIRNITIYGLPCTRSRTPVVLFNLAGIPARELAAGLDAEEDIAVRGGVHCAPLVHETIGTAPQGAVRASPGPTTTEDQIDHFLRIIDQAANYPPGATG
ncbi:MAG: aminotransferase class V-fold PLP-dependent enzyme [Phycisphaerales bacterium]|nr:aminotransferase class V-fold PLP-dependent enzyme [Planctomycetota bacterium]MCH8508310.1 aminotransferase class V-fold PLP-dependent enzyme [Phycisphaerales bacterium]